MTIIVEDGTGKADAESYISVEDADTYHSGRNNAAWAVLSTTVKEGCLRIATEFMLGEYTSQWLGSRHTSTQALDWPRDQVIIKEYDNRIVPNTAIPQEVKNACAELALRASITTLREDLGQRTTEETVGPITVKYDQYSPQQPRYPQINAMLRVYLRSGGNSAMVKLGRR